MRIFGLRAAVQVDRDFAAELYSADMQPCPGKSRAHWMAIRLARKSAAACVLSILVSAAPVAAGVTRITIDQKQSPAYEGKSFGGAGQYEILTGRAFGELDPRDPHNTIITDLEFAPRNRVARWSTWRRSLS